MSAQDNLRDKRNLAKQDYEAAKYEKGNINNRYRQAEEKYYTVHDQQPKYRQILRQRYTDEAKKITEKWKEQFEDKYGDIMDLIKFYNSQYNYVPQMNDMEKIYKEKNEHLYGKLESDLNKSNVSKRLADYYNNLSNIQNFVNSYLKYIYWGTYIIMIGVFIYKRQFINILAYPVLIFFILFPLFFLNRFVSLVFRHMNHVQIDALYLTLAAAVIIMIGVMSALSNPILK